MNGANVSVFDRETISIPRALIHSADLRRGSMMGSPWLTNPYVTDEPIRTTDDFFGRDAEVAQLLTRIRRGTSTVILAPPRMGSTSLLNRLAQNDIRAGLDDIVVGLEL